MTDNKIVYNAIRTPDGTLLESFHTHDFKTHKDKNGQVYMVDGGLSYIRRSGSGHQELCLVESDPIEEIREVFSWGTYGKSGDEPFKRVLLKDMTEEHIKAIISDGTYQWNALMMRELQYRKENNIHIED